MLKLLLSKDLKLWILGEKYLSYTLSIPHLFNYQIVPSFSTLPTGISKIVDHPLRHNFDLSIFLGEKKDTMLKLINILQRKSRVFLILQDIPALTKNTNMDIWAVGTSN